jgi:hypothetical protein
MRIIRTPLTMKRSCLPPRPSWIACAKGDSFDSFGQARNRRFRAVLFRPLNM